MKRIYYVIESNHDLSITVKSTACLKNIMESDLEGLTESEIEEFVYTVTPVLMTKKEFDNLQDAD